MTAVRTLAPHHVAVPGSSFTLWRAAVLRSAGLPVDAVDGLADERLLAAVTAIVAARRPGARLDPHAVAADEGFQAAWAAAIERQSAALRDLAADPVLREAVAWQVPRLVPAVLDVIATRDPDGRNSKWRERERTTASYAQRYATKNDTIGFFGPVAWARWADDLDGGAALRVGDALTAHRSVHFETWAVDAVGAALVARHGLRPHVPPRRNPANHLDGDVLHRPYRRPTTLDPERAAVLRACDGDATAREIADDLTWLGTPGIATEAEVFAALERLVGDGLVTWDLDVPMASHPDRELAARLRAIPGADPDAAAARDAALADLAELVAAKDALAATAGDADAVGPATAALGAVFTRVTGEESFRRGGEHEAGRTLTYLDARRDVDLTLSTALLADVAPALDLLLRSARWYGADVAARYRAELDALFDAAIARPGQDPDDVPLSLLTFQLGPRLIGDGVKPPDEAAAELRRRWSAVLGEPTGPGVRRLASAELAARVDEAFPAGDGPRWAAARYHSPDFLIAAPSVEAIVPGVTEVVLGELHAVWNSADSRSFAAQHPDPVDGIRALMAADGLTGRIAPVLPKSWRAVNARVSPPANAPDHYTWFSLTQDSGGPAPSHPVAALRVRRDPATGRLVVRSVAPGLPPFGGPDGSGEADVIEVLGELISMVTVTEFGVLPKGAERTPRVVIDRLVVQRETWRPTAASFALPHARFEAAEHVATVRRLAELGVPRRFFTVVPGQPKPMYVDAASPVLVQNFARFVRATVDDHGPGETITLSEMLPDPEHCWLRDARGRRYTSELRMVAVDQWQA